MTLPVLRCSVQLFERKGIPLMRVCGMDYLLLQRVAAGLGMSQGDLLEQLSTPEAQARIHAAMPAFLKMLAKKGNTDA